MKIVNKKCEIFLVFLIFGQPATCTVNCYSTDYLISRSVKWDRGAGPGS